MRWPKPHLIDLVNRSSVEMVAEKGPGRLWRVCFCRTRVCSRERWLLRDTGGRLPISRVPLMFSFLRASASLVAFSLLNHFTATEESITISISDHGPAIFGSLLLRSSPVSWTILEVCLWIRRPRASPFGALFPRWKRPR